MTSGATSGSGCARAHSKARFSRPAIVEDWSQLDDLHLPDYSHPDCADFMNALFAEPSPAQVGPHRRLGVRQRTLLAAMEIYFGGHGALPRRAPPHARHRRGRLRAEDPSGGQGWCRWHHDRRGYGTQTGLLFSPRMFREYFKPMYTRLMAIAHDYGMKVLMHSCGQNWSIVPDLFDAGVDVFQARPARSLRYAETRCAATERKYGLEPRRHPEDPAHGRTAR